MGEIVTLPFYGNKEKEPLSERDLELLELWEKGSSGDENLLQRKYRINRLAEFDDLVMQLTSSDYPDVKK